VYIKRLFKPLSSIISLKWLDPNIFDIIKIFFEKTIIIIAIFSISMVSSALIVSLFLILTYGLGLLTNGLNLNQDPAFLAINMISQAQFAVIFIIMSTITTISTIKLIKKEGT